MIIGNDSSRITQVLRSIGRCQIRFIEWFLVHKDMGESVGVGRQLAGQKECVGTNIS